jgi:hypothetical protein
VKILIAGYFSAFWHEDAWLRALREMGHNVVGFPFKNYFPDNISGRIQNRFMIGPVISKINEDLIRYVEEIMPDVVLCYRALPVTAATIRYLSSTDASRILVCYNNDNAFGELSSKSYWRLYKATIPFYDLHLAYRDSDVPHLNKNASTHVLHPHNMPWLHRVLPKSDFVGWESDICFLGHFEPDRRQKELDVLMKKVPAHYRLNGSFWKENSKDMAWQGMDTKELQGEDYVRALNATKIALVFFSTWNADTFTRRVFEIPACGTMMLSQRTDTMLDLYAEDKEAIYFSSAEELVDKARYYLAHDTLRVQIAEAGRKRCLDSGYDIYSRMSEWITVVETMQKTKAI